MVGTKPLPQQEKKINWVNQNFPWGIKKKNSECGEMETMGETLKHCIRKYLEVNMTIRCVTM